MNWQVLLTEVLRWMRLLAWIAASLTAGIILMSIWYPSTVAVIVAVIAKICLSKTIKTFKLARFSLCPFFMDEFEMEMRAVGKNPDIAISWKRFAILMDYRWFTDMLCRRLTYLKGESLSIAPHPLVTFEFQSMHMKSDTMMFKHMLEPSSKVKPPKYEDAESWVMSRIKRFKAYLFFLRFGRLLTRGLDRLKYVLMNGVILLFEVRFLDISFDFHMPAHQCSMHGHADLMGLMFTHSKELQDEGFQIINVIQGGSMEVFDEGLTAVHYVGKAARIAVDYHHVSKMMDIYINIYGTDDDMAVHIKPFLSLYMKYQRAEDDSIETKMSLGLPTNGKMSISMEMETMKVSVKDERCPKLLIITMNNVKAEMANFLLTTDGKRTHKGKLCDMSAQYADRMIPPLLHHVFNFSSNVEKVMKILCCKVVFSVKDNKVETVHSRYDHTDTNMRYTVLGVAMNKMLEVKNCGDYIDQDHMEISAKSVNFENCPSELFHWLVVLQDTSDRLPSCRFNHKKNNEMKVLVNYFVISIQPYAYDHDVYAPANSEKYTFHPNVHLTRLLPQIPIDSNRWICYTLRQMTVKVERKLHVKDNISHYSMSMEKLTIHAYTPLLDLRKQYSMKTPRQYRPLKQQRSFRKMGSLELSTDSDMDDDEDPLDFIPTFSQVDIRSELFEEIMEQYEERRRDDLMGKYDDGEDDLHNVSIWTFDDFSAAFWLGAKMEFEYVKSRIFTISMDTFSWSRDLSSLLTKYDIVSLKHSKQEGFGLEVMWMQQAMNVNMDKVHCNLSLAGCLALQTAFGMIKQSVNRINFTITLAKQRAPDLSNAMIKSVVPPGSHYMSASHHSRGSLASAIPEEKKAEPVQSSTRVGVKDMVLVIAAESQLNRNHIDADREVQTPTYSNQVMSVLMQSMVMESMGAQMGVIMSTIDCRLSKFPNKPFFAVYNFSAGKNGVAAMSPMNKCKEDYDEMECSVDRVIYHLHPVMEVGVLVDSMLLQYNAFKIAVDPRSSLLDSLISWEEDTLFYSAVEASDDTFAKKVSVGDLDLYSTYRDHDSASSTQMEAFTTVEQVNKRFIAKLKINKMEINFDAPWEGIFKDELMTILYDGMTMEVDNTLSFAEIEDLISVLDIGEENVNTATSDMVLRYGNVSGGHIKFDCNKFEVNLLTQKEVLLSINDLAFIGPVYNASVMDDRIPVDVKLIDINDAILVSLDSLDAVYRKQRSAADKNTRLQPFKATENEGAGFGDNGMTQTVPPPESWAIRPVVGVPLFALQSSRQGSSKIYLDMSVTSKTMTLHIFPDTLKCIAVVNTVLEICQPPNRDPSPCMAPWDTMRFFLHGSFALNTQKLELYYHANDYMRQEVLISVIIDRYRLFVDQSNVEVATKDIRVEAELSTVILTRRHRSARSNQRMKHVAKFVHIPSFVLAVQHKYDKDYIAFMKKLHGKSIYTHHDVYLLPAVHSDSVDDGSMFSLLYDPSNTPEKEEKLQYIRKDLVRFFYKGEFSPFLFYTAHDKYYYFRSRPCSISYNIEMRLANGVNNYSILPSLSGGTDDKLPVLMFFRVDNIIRVVDAINYSSSVTEDHSAPTRSAAGISLPTNGIVKPTTTLSINQIINSLDMTMIINRALLVAWPSRTCLLGIIMHQQLSELQVRVTRTMPLAPNDDKAKPETSKVPKNSPVFTFSDSFYIGSHVDFSSKLVPEVDDKLYPMQIDHMVVDIYFAEIYARNLNLSQADVQGELVKYNVPTLLANNMRESGSDFGRSSIGTSGMQRQSATARASIDATSGADEDGHVFEPSKLEHVYSLMNNIRKLSYASKVIISLTENGSVANKLNTFVSTGILSVIDDEEDLEAFYARISKAEEGSNAAKNANKKQAKGFLIGKEWRRFTLGDNPVDLRRLTLLRRSNIGSSVSKSGSFGNRKHSNSFNVVGSVALSKRRMTMMPSVSSISAISKVDSSSKGYRASLLSFMQNHAVFTPPSFALPVSYSRSKPASAYFGGSTAQTKDGTGSSSTPAPDDVSSFGNKIWGLRVIDTKFLFTIDIRDSLFIFVSRSMDFVTAGSNDEHTRDPQNEKYVHHADNNADERQSDNGEDDSVKNIDMSLINAAALSARRNSKSFSSMRRNSVNKASLSDFLQVTEEQPDTSWSIVQHHLDAQTQQEDGGANAGVSDGESVAESTIAKHLLNFPEDNSPNKLGQFDFSVDPSASRRISAEALESLEVMHMTADSPGQNTSIAARNRAYNTGGRGLKRAAAVHRRGSLFNKSIDVGQSDSLKNSSQPQLLDTPATPRASVKGEAKQQPAAKSGKGPKHTSLNQFFFIVELIDPQLNFLDTDSHSSLLIVAGRSSLEGKRMNSATLPSLVSTAAVVADTEEHIQMNTPKRRQEIRLRMDNVTAYTVPTANDDEEEDEVYWKNTQSSVESFQLRPLQGTAKAVSNKAIPAPIFGRKQNNTATSPKKKLTIQTEHTTSFLSSPDSLNSNSSNISMAPTPRKVYKFRADKVDPSTMQMAIKDFQIRAVYIFWTDVTVSEAKELKIIRSKEDLICTFRLELPNLAVDINSKQFHITMNVIKNVMLVPPPLLQNKRAAENAAANRNVIELQRNPEVLQKYDVKPTNAPLDMGYKSARDEIKAYVDECLGSNLFDLSNQQTERYTEVFIGRLTWVLRNNTSNVPTPLSSLYGNPGVQANASVTSSKGDKEYELVESGFIGIYATLTFTKSRCINSLLEIQRFWAKNIDPTLETSIAPRGSIVQNSVDPSPLNKSTSSNVIDRSVVVQPVLAEEDFCARCHNVFKIEENHSAACTFHADDDGNPGVFKTIVLKDELTGQDTTIEAWTCCMRHHKFAPGCSMRPHICKEVMISLRAEVFPTTKIDNVEVTIFKTLDVSIFPGANYDLKLQVTRNLSEFLHKYFSLESVENDASLETASIPDASSDSTTGGLTRRHSKTIDSIDSSGGSESSGPKQKRKSLVSFIKKKTFVRRFTQGDVAADVQKQAGASIKPTSSWTLGSRKSTTSTPENSTSSGGGMPGNSRERASIKNGLSSSAQQTAVTADSKGGKQKCSKQEGLYIKYMRVGEINIDVSTLGFAINLDKFKAVMEPFFCRGEVLTWTKLIWSFERHLVWSLTKHTATTGLNKIGEFLRLNSKAQTMQLLLKDDKMDPEQALAIKRAMLLGSPEAPSRIRGLTVTTPSTSFKSPVSGAAPIKSPTTPLPSVRSPSVSPKGSLNINLFQRDRRQQAVSELKEDVEERDEGTKGKSRENMSTLLGRSA